jgi:ParB-like chromosome segregation protein Spo0J
MKHKTPAQSKRPAKPAKRAKSAGKDSVKAGIETSIELWPIADVKRYGNNPRVNDPAVDAVAKSIAEFGFNNPIQVDAAGTIIAGDTRYKAAQKLGLTHVPVIVQRNMSAAQVRAYRIADNKTGELATWDDALLLAELNALSEQRFDLSVLGFDDDELVSLMSPPAAAADPAEVEVPPSFQVAVECADEADQKAVYDLLTGKGYKCRVLTL